MTDISNDTNFVDEVTVIEPGWLNIINDFFHTLFAGAETVGEAQTALSLVPGTDVMVHAANNATSSSTNTFTNKTFDANGTGNSLSNVDVADLANGTDGELITWSAAGAPTTVAVGTADQVLTSNGAGAAPTFQTIVQDLTYTEITTATNLAVGNSYYAKNTAATHTLPLLSGLTDGDRIHISISGGNVAVIVNEHATDGGTESWTGYAEGDYCHFIVVDGAWHWEDEKVTVEVAAYLTSDETIGISTVAKIFDVNYTVITDIGGWWDSATNHRLDIGFNCFATLTIGLLTGSPEISPQYNRSGTVKFDPTAAGASANFGQTCMLTNTRDHTSGQYIEIYAENTDAGATHIVRGDSGNDESFFHFKVLGRKR
jgi:hypothetical protein